MSFPLQINNSLFFRYNGELEASWGLACGDGSTDAKRLAHINWCQKYRCDGIILCLNNEGYISLFRDRYLGALDWNKWNSLLRYVIDLKSMGAKIVFAFFDGPEDKSGHYWPILSQLDKHAAFIQAACQALNPFASAYLIGCETNRYWDSATVREAIRVTKQYAGLIPVGTHEQWDPHTREFPGGDFCCYETRNHPKDGDAVSVADMVAEVRHIQTHLPPNFPVWVAEHNLNPDGAHSRAQARALAELPGVIGVGGPI